MLTPVTAIEGKLTGGWNLFEIIVQGQTYKVALNGVEVTVFNFVAGSDAAHPERGLPRTNAVPRFIGLQRHTGRALSATYRLSRSSRTEPAASNRVVLSDRFRGGMRWP